MVTVRINRHRPAKVGDSFTGGFNARHGGVVDMHWLPYPERDVIGYSVQRASDGAVICGPAGGVQWTKTRCTDRNPPSGGSETYSVVAIDCDTPSVTTCTPRVGEAMPLNVTLSAGAAPAAPTNVQVTLGTEGLPVLTWTAPASGTVLFYRIYRDSGTALADRYDETITDDPTYTDPNPGSTSTHRYWVTAVDSQFNESAPSNYADLP